MTEATNTNTQRYPATEQEVFDKVWNHFVVNHGKQSRMQSPNGSTKCLYRGMDGAKCAVGLFIPDEDYRDWYDADGSMDVANLKDRLYECGLANNLVELREFLDANFDLLQALQAAHDDDFSHIEGSLRAVAEDNNLKVPS